MGLFLMRLKFAGLSRFYAGFWIAWALGMILSILSRPFSPSDPLWSLFLVAVVILWFFNAAFMSRKSIWGHPKVPPKSIVVAHFGLMTTIFLFVFRFLL